LKLIPCKPNLISAQDINVLTEWRNLYPSAFLIEFIADENRTFRWLSQAEHPDDGKFYLCWKMNMAGVSDIWGLLLLTGKSLMVNQTL